MKFAAWYAILVGCLMVGQWIFFLISGQVPELQTEPIRLYFHLASEFLTAMMLLIGGLGLLKELAWAKPLYLVAAGMLLYSIIVSPGYFAQQGQWALVGMFALLLCLTLASMTMVVRHKITG